MSIQSKNKLLTIGIELEWQLIDLNSFNLSSNSNLLLNELKDISYPGIFKPEITMGMIEFNSTVHLTIEPLLQELKFVKEIIVTEAKKLNLGICGGGCHPFDRWQEQTIFPQEPFLSDFDEFGYLAKQFTVFGQHIHVGCDDNDTSIYLCHALTQYIPHFIALAAASPFYESVDTHFDSSRITILNSFPFCGAMPWLENWNDFYNYIQDIQNLKMIKSSSDFFWDIRPRPNLKTIEIRVCDSPLTHEKSADFAAYAQMLVYFLLDERIPISKHIYFPYNYNRFNAAKNGFNADYIDPLSRQRLFLKDHIFETCFKLKTYAKELNSESSLKRIINLAANESNDARWIRDQYKTLNSHSDVIKEQIRLWENEEAVRT